MPKIDKEKVRILSDLISGAFTRKPNGEIHRYIDLVSIIDDKQSWEIRVTGPSGEVVAVISVARLFMHIFRVRQKSIYFSTAYAVLTRRRSYG